MDIAHFLDSPMTNPQLQISHLSGLGCTSSVHCSQWKFDALISPVSIVFWQSEQDPDKQQLFYIFQCLLTKQEKISDSKTSSIALYVQIVHM